MKMAASTTRTLSNLAGGLMLAALVALAPPIATAEELPEADMWPGIRKEVFAQRDILESDGRIALESPYRAEDAALVPLTMRIPASVARDAVALTLIVDKNPAPVVAKFEFGPAAGPGERMISTRVRIDMYSHVRAVLETADGKLHMVTKYVKASGGCSAPAGKDADAALASLGRMQIKTYDQLSGPAAANASAMREAQIMVKHPNYTGMQMDQLTRQYTPAMYVNTMEVTRGGERVFRMEGGISVSEDPAIRFTYGAAPEETLEARITDTEGRIFSTKSAPKGS